MGRLGISLLLWLEAAACASPLPGKSGVLEQGAPADATTAGAPVIQFDPPAAPGSITPVTRITVTLPEPLADPRVLLVAGALSSSQLRDLARPVLPDTLVARQVSVLAWTEAGGLRLDVAPLVVLMPGVYSLGISGLPQAFAFTVAAGDPGLVLERVFPDHADIEAAAQTVVWCGSQAIGVDDAAVALAPAQLQGRLSSGTGAPFAAPDCLSFQPVENGSGSDRGLALPAVTPPSWVLADQRPVLLEPTMLWPVEGALSEEDLACSAGLLRFGPGCARVEDDRVTVYGPPEPVLWTIDTVPGSALVRATRQGSRFIARPIPNDATFGVATLDRAGRTSVERVPVVPAPPAPHVVINEVLANPAGPEPAEEWIELYNDGSSVVSLSGFRLNDAGGATVLPDVALEPQAYALVVGADYEEDDGVDPVPAPGTMLIRVPSVGKSGLSNEGEALALRDPDGRVLSLFPARKTKNGVSVARVAPDAPDDDAASFEPSRNESATPGAPNDR